MMEVKVSYVKIVFMYGFFLYKDNKEWSLNVFK